jgi:hypothetical protein
LDTWRWPADRPQREGSASVRYELPALFGGDNFPSIEAWRGHRRRLLDGLAEHIYGYTPADGSLAGVTLLSRQPVLGSRGIMTEWLMTVAGPRCSMDVPLLVFQPADSVPAGGSPVFLGMNIVGNHALTSLPGVRLGSWMPVTWPVRKIVERGYAVATLLHDSIEPDMDGGAWCGVRSLFQSADSLETQGPTQWGALGAWAWGLSRAREALATIEGLDGDRVIVHGHSRLGMTALWAAAQDERFAAAVSSESGLGGASLARHIEGEDIAFASSHFPYWFCGNYATFAGRDAEFPVDQHQLLALIAPRPIHVSSAARDRHADPEGEFLATLHASPAYELYGLRGTLPGPSRRKEFELTPAEASLVPAPDIGRRIGGALSYHVREGGHGVTESDWSVFLDFADANGLLP